MRIYHAHAKCTYGRPVEVFEQDIIRKGFPGQDLVDPGSYEDNIEKMMGGIDYCLELVESCHVLVFSRILGKVTAGVGKEVEHALGFGKPVFEIIGDSLKRIFQAPEYVSIEETLDLYSRWEEKYL